jgi:hypothetical protein
MSAAAHAQENIPQPFLDAWNEAKLPQERLSSRWRRYLAWHVRQRGATADRRLDDWRRHVGFEVTDYTKAKVLSMQEHVERKAEEARKAREQQAADWEYRREAVTLDRYQGSQEFEAFRKAHPDMGPLTMIWAYADASVKKGKCPGCPRCRAARRDGR